MNDIEFNQLIQRARQADLLEYFRTSGYQIEPHGVNYYIKDFPGLCIRPDNNQWYNHYTNEGRTNNSLDCLTNVCGRDFTQAVFELTGEDISIKRSSDFKDPEHKPKYTSSPLPVLRNNTSSEKENKELKMPKQSKTMRRLFAYFCQTRKIPSEIVEELIHKKLLYQSENDFVSTKDGEEHHFRNANAVFVHKDENGKVIGAEIQGTSSYKRYKGVASGTGESCFTFTPVPAESNKIQKAFIFESAIDLMSFYSFCDKQKLTGCMLVSMAGLKPTYPKKLEAEGVQIISCVDNDDAGRKFESDNNFKRSESVKNYLDKNNIKDWNELLVYKNMHPDFDLLANAKNENNEQESITRGR